MRKYAALILLIIVTTLFFHFGTKHPALGKRKYIDEHLDCFYYGLYRFDVYEVDLSFTHLNKDFPYRSKNVEPEFYNWMKFNELSAELKEFIIVDLQYALIETEKNQYLLKLLTMINEDDELYFAGEVDTNGSGSFFVNELYFIDLNENLYFEVEDIN